jgi:hypothetical protein
MGIALETRRDGSQQLLLGEFGVPLILQSDNGKEFIDNVIKKIIPSHYYIIQMELQNETFKLLWKFDNPLLILKG